MATILVTNGNAAIEVGNVEGARVAGLILEAGTVRSETLLKVGAKGD